MLKAVNAGPGYPGVSMATRASDVDLLFLAGHCPTDKDGNVVEGDFEAQVKAVFENLKQTLEAAGVGFEAVAKFTTYITDAEPETIATFKKVRNQYVNADCPPANALVTVVALYDPAIRIEMDGVAVIPRQTK